MLDADPDGLIAVAFSPAGDHLASAGRGGVKLWDVGVSPAVLDRSFPARRVTSVVVAPDGATLAAGLEDGGILLWRTGGEEPPVSFVGHANRVNSVAFSPDGKALASASLDHTAKLWDVATGLTVTDASGIFSV